ncbi:type IV pilin protein [Thermosulfurimonas sp. F29]|uniref:type IV pilin protein n=1 Tax=Thermosulfurimonas sp. F29 TaxID=2867247 RepID=UPI0021027ACC|nr:prepilin-type N-terminal cleavage/methylation domain-containing protein [Thermosulfurimonas sp. F29]
MFRSQRSSLGYEGFTLVEVLMVLAILAILASFSVAIYRHYFRSAFEVDPVQVLLAAKMAQEEYYADHDRYACQIEELAGFNDGTADNKYQLNSDKDARRRFYITANCTDNGTGYILTVKNDSNDPKWRIEWTLSCNATANVGECKPVQVSGSSTLGNIF